MMRCAGFAWSRSVRFKNLSATKGGTPPVEAIQFKPQLILDFVIIRQCPDPILIFEGAAATVAMFEAGMLTFKQISWMHLGWTVRIV